MLHGYSNKGNSNSSNNSPTITATGLVLHGATPNPNEKKDLWLHAWSDPLANVKAFSSCIELADLNGDGDHKLILADESKRMKVYKGTTVMLQSALMDFPVAVCTYYMNLAAPRRPVIAIASGPHLFIYRDYVPYTKFTLPNLPVHATEQDVWNRLKAGKVDPNTAIQELENARDQGVELTSVSLDLLSMEDPSEMMQFIEKNKNNVLIQQVAIFFLSRCWG